MDVSVWLDNNDDNRRVSQNYMRRHVTDIWEQEVPPVVDMFLSVEF